MLFSYSLYSVYIYLHWCQKHCFGDVRYLTVLDVWHNFSLQN